MTPHVSSRLPLADRFELSYVPEPNSGCWLWTGASSERYGKIVHHGKPCRAHRISWLLHKGQVPEGLHVLHRCDTPMCVNPSHLFLGTHADNMRDRNKKGRTNPNRGVAHHRSKLTDDDVRMIRELFGEGVRICDISKRMSVSHGAVSSIVKGRTWGHLT